MNEFNAKIADIGIVPVIKLNNPERDAAPLAKALCDGGVPVAEVTFRAEGADKAIAIMRKERPEMLVGAGTVTRTEQIDRVKEAGGQFVVTPGFDPELVAYAQKAGLPIFPGCTSATDYHAALKFGLEVIKFFPAEQEGGLAKIKALSAPFPMFRIMPTGGISLKNLAAYIACPVIAACGGSFMVTADLLDSQNWAEVTRLCKEARKIINEVRAK
ncbi:MAG: bifunctional 4-hydroxy-2-oxoglutarate aldolase/2-dehydro-3-deoxy-phosphogluconate aldolase [Treponema sp.]|nr:bifunctional 4-hydroxy-2-oxoglutarate aldolase/2-dehydro-3-deoxy-phosphogluconate aldolase [Treponema sp.]